MKKKSPRSKFFYPLKILILSTIILSACNQTEKIITTPNIILIMADDLGYGDLSCYGNPYIRTPHIDQLATEGLRFTDYHSNGAVCSPTRAALMSGLYQQRVGIPGVVLTTLRDSLGMAQEVETFAEVFQAEGYKTGIFGKWHLGYNTKYNPIRQGFDEFRGFVAGNVDYHSHLDNQMIFDWWRDTTLEDDPGYTTDLITKYGLDFINRNQDKPFLLYLPYPAPHNPYEGRSDPPVRVKGKENREIATEDIPGIYKEMVEVLDEGIGQLIQNLKRLGLERNTLVFFCSDNGATRNGSNGNLRGFKGGLYEGGHRVPAIARWPGMIASGRTTDETILSMDLFPTLLEIANVQTKTRKLDGRSFAPVLISEDPMPMRDLFWKYNKQIIMRRGDWKLIIDGGEAALYNLKTDLGEGVNLAGEEAGLFEEMRGILDEWEQGL